MRLGQPKQLLEYQGTSLLRRSAETALASVCHPIVAVLGAHSDRMKAELHALPIVTIQNPDWEQGMGTSLRYGVNALPPDIAAAVVILCDQPLLTAGTINALIAAHHESNAPIVASEYGGVAGVPALFDCSFFPELSSLPPPEGARSLFRRYPERVHRVPFPEGKIDIDTMGDYQALMQEGILPQT